MFLTALTGLFFGAGVTSMFFLRLLRRGNQEMLGVEFGIDAVQAEVERLSAQTRQLTIKRLTAHDSWASAGIEDPEVGA